MRQKGQKEKKKEMEALKIEMIEYKDSKILADLNMEK